MKMGDGSGVPRVASHGACKKGEKIVDEMGKNLFHNFLG